MSYHRDWHTDEQEEAANKERKAKRSAIMQKIVETLKASGAEVVLRVYTEPAPYSYMENERTDYDIESVNGERISYDLTVKLESCYPDSPKEWSMSRCSRFGFGYCGREGKFIEGKAGFKYQEIADAFIRLAARDKERRERDNRWKMGRKSSELLQKHLEAAYGDSWCKPIRTEVCAMTDCVKLNVGQTLTLDEAVSFLNILKFAGGEARVSINITEPVNETVAAAALRFSNKLHDEKNKVLTPAE